VAPTGGQAAAPGVASAPAASPAGTITFRFRGELVDQQNRPISGVFKMEFSIANDRESVPFWREGRYVAVQEGMYELSLGESTPLPASFEGRTVAIRTTLGSDQPEGPPVMWVVTAPPTRPDGGLPPDLRGRSFVDVADRAIEADRAIVAENCLSLGGKPAAELDKSAEFNRLLSEIRAEIRDKGGAKLSAETQVLERAGGPGGNPYQRQCPPNHVVTGFRGGMGNFLDSIEIVCSPIE
jgi:hypothetical protein